MTWTSTKQRPLAERFAEKVDRRGPDECWPWLASRGGFGHGQICGGSELGRRPINAHRVAFWLEHGYLPECVRHQCDNPPCCNPAHLEPGTMRENRMDMVIRGRQPSGDNHWRRKRPPVVFDHGTIARYRQGCRCDDCKADNARVARERRANTKAATHA